MRYLLCEMSSYDDFVGWCCSCNDIARFLVSPHGLLVARLSQPGRMSGPWTVDLRPNDHGMEMDMGVPGRG